MEDVKEEEPNATNHGVCQTQRQYDHHQTTCLTSEIKYLVLLKINFNATNQNLSFKMLSVISVLSNT